MHWYIKKPNSQPAEIDLHLEEQARRVQIYSPSETGPVLEKLENWMRFLGYSRKDIFAVTLALTEAMANAFRHGNRHDPKKFIRVSYLVSHIEVLLEVQDQGPGFDPEQVPDPLAKEFLDRPAGRGLFLMRAYMSWVAFNAQGNRVTLCRRRTDL
jgi:serine/threonine-protein kinase RsbW